MLAIAELAPPPPPPPSAGGAAGERAAGGDERVGCGGEEEGLPVYSVHSRRLGVTKVAAPPGLPSPPRGRRRRRRRRRVLGERLQLAARRWPQPEVGGARGELVERAHAQRRVVRRAARLEGTHGRGGSVGHLEL